MAKLPILRYPDPRLHQKSTPVLQVDARIKQLAADMAETMYAAPGVGLAAPQVGVLERMVVIDATEDKTSLLTLINPEIVFKEGECVCEEGCLSVPDIYERVSRAAKVKVRALNLEAKTFELEAEGLLAVCIQHELDHLDGKVFVDYLSMLKQGRIQRKMLKRTKAGD